MIPYELLASGHTAFGVFVDWGNWAVGFEFQSRPRRDDPLGQHYTVLVMIGPLCFIAHFPKFQLTRPR